MKFEHIYPATGRPNGTVDLAGAAEIDDAVTAAAKAQRQWNHLRLAVIQRKMTSKKIRQNKNQGEADVRRKEEKK